MPASAGRVRMPHNNRMSTSGALQTSDIWQKTIGQDPHGDRNEGNSTLVSTQLHQERVDATEIVLAAAREQNATGQTQGRDDFALKLYQGLKQKKKQRATDVEAKHAAKYPSREELLLQEQDSSSEEEYVVAKKESTDKTKKNKRKHRRDDTSSNSDNSSSERRRRKWKKHKRKKRKHPDEADDDESSSSHSRKKKKSKTSRHHKPSKFQTR